MAGRCLPERTVVTADDYDLLLRVDVLHSAVVVPIAMRLAESSKRVPLREPSPHQALPWSDSLPPIGQLGFGSRNQATTTAGIGDRSDNQP